jgi:hypothetical protein
VNDHRPCLYSLGFGGAVDLADAHQLPNEVGRAGRQAIQTVRPTQICRIVGLARCKEFGKSERIVEWSLRGK